MPGRSTYWLIVGQGHIALVVRAKGSCLDIYSPLSFLFSFSLSLVYCPI